MCGIIGYASKSCNALNVTVDCLKNLEYRGYDSSGVAVVENDNILVYKDTGKIKKLEQRLQKQRILTNTVIAHTRWATHGEPSILNAHPHRSDQVTLVHNGIIENYAELESKLFIAGYDFMSETDTEVAAAYFDYMLISSNSNVEAISHACNDFEGTFAFGILFQNEPNTIYAIRKSSPLIIALSSRGNFIASDVSDVLKYTNKYILLEDYEIAKVTKDAVTVYDKNLKIIEKEIQIAKWDITKYQKNGYDHFMLKEIHEQPEVLNALFKKIDSLNNNMNFNLYYG